MSSEPTHYLNVDLDIVSRGPLADLVEAMGEEVFVLHAGRKGRGHEAHVELASSHLGMTADRTIIGLAAVVKRLAPRYRKIWNSARSRDFNIGIEAGLEPHAYELRLSRQTIDTIAEVGASVVVTVYAPVIATQGPAARKRTPARKRPGA